MKRQAGAALCSAMLAVTASVGARGGGETEGEVLLPVASPAFARSLYDEGIGPNGLTGYVIRLGRVVPPGTDYELRKTGGPPGADLDVYFYEDIDDGASCQTPRHQPDGEGGETGEFTCHARWAIVTLFTGVAVEFELEW